MVSGESGPPPDVNADCNRISGDERHAFAIATGTVGITPTTCVPLGSYRSLRKPAFDAVADELEANVLVLRAGTGLPTLFVSADLLYVGAYICDRIFAGLADRLPRDRILVAASHTHFAPATDESLPGLGRVSQEYLEFAATRILDLATRLLDARAEPVVCRYHEGTTRHSINRRRTRFGIARSYPYLGFHTDISPNEHGPRDDLIRALTLTRPDGRVGAICWSFACHPNTFPHIDSVSAEYPGRVRELLRRRFGAVPVLFWQGFSGNINPYRAVQSATTGDDGRSKFVSPTLSQWNVWTDSLAESVRQVVSTPGKPLGGPVTCDMRSMEVRELGLRSEKRLTYRKISFGGDLALCGLSAEVAVEYVTRLQELFPLVKVVPVGCIDEVFGYLPVDEMIDRGGYEVRGFLRRFGLKGTYRRDLSAIVERRLFAAPDAGRHEPRTAAVRDPGRLS